MSWFWPSGAADREGADEYERGRAEKDSVRVHHLGESLWTTLDSLYLHMLDFSETGVKATIRLALVPLDQTVEGTLHGDLLDLVARLETSASGSVILALETSRDDAWSINHAEWAMEGKSAAPGVPAFGGALGGATPGSHAGYRLRNSTP